MIQGCMFIFLMPGRVGTNKFGDWGWSPSCSPRWYWRCKDYRKLCCGKLAFCFFFDLFMVCYLLIHHLVIVHGFNFSSTGPRKYACMLHYFCSSKKYKINVNLRIVKKHSLMSLDCSSFEPPYNCLFVL